MAVDTLGAVLISLRCRSLRSRKKAPAGERTGARLWPEAADGELVIWDEVRARRVLVSFRDWPVHVRVRVLTRTGFPGPHG